MLDGVVCAKCGSNRVIPCVNIVDSTGTGAVRELTVELYEKPEALLFKGVHKGTLTARICGDCGFTELYLENPGELWAAYLKLTT